MIGVDIIGLDKFKANINSLGSVLRKESYMMAVLLYLKHVLEERIFSMGAYLVGERFEPNAPATIAKKGFDHPLYETGEMVSSLVVESTPSNHFVGVSGADNAYKAEINEYGGIDGGSVIPPRRWFSSTIESDAVIEGMMGKITIEVKRAWR
jgi:hypothetical protein